MMKKKNLIFLIITLILNFYSYNIAPSFGIYKETKNLSVLLNVAKPIDNDPVHISNVNFYRKEYKNGNLELSLSWENNDEGFQTDTKYYYIQLYQSGNNQLIETFEVPGNITINNYTLVLDSSFLNNNDTIMNNANNTFYVRIYGVDEAGNSGLSSCSEVTNDLCPISNSTILKYKYSLKISGDNISSSTSDIYYKDSYSKQISSSGNNYVINDSVSVTTKNEQGQTISWTNNNEYSYIVDSNSPNKGTIQISAGEIVNDVEVEASAKYSQECLLEGTKIRLADGTTKNIEDIKYDDLLIAISHDTGEIVYEYPIWIEKEGHDNHYQLNEFSDGTILKTVGNHGVFSVDAGKYVLVEDAENFHIGTRVIKINENNEKEIVTVTNIETIYEDVNYYHISSTYYHNIIAENLLTTDSILIVSNMFPFNSDLAWTKEREEFIKKGDLFDYNDWSNIFPEHIFKGFRMEEAMILQQQGILDINLFNVILNRKIAEPYKNENGKYEWIINFADYGSDFITEGTYITIPTPVNVDNKKFKGYFNHADNKYYLPGDNIKVIYSMYFEPIWIDNN